MVCRNWYVFAFFLIDDAKQDWRKKDCSRKTEQENQNDSVFPIRSRIENLIGTAILFYYSNWNAHLTIVAALCSKIPGIPVWLGSVTEYWLFELLEYNRITSLIFVMTHTFFMNIIRSYRTTTGNSEFMHNIVLKTFFVKLCRIIGVEFGQLENL